MKKAEGDAENLPRPNAHPWSQVHGTGRFTMTKRKKGFTAAITVREISREVFRAMPKGKRIADKRFKKPRFKERDEN